MECYGSGAETFVREWITAKNLPRPILLHPKAALDPWADRARELLKEEMFRRNLTYRELAERLAPYGVMTPPDQLNRMVNRGKFSAAFLFACLAAMEIAAIKVPSQLGR